MHFYIILNDHTLARVEANSINAVIQYVLTEYADGCDLFDNDMSIISEDEMIERMEKQL